MIITKMSVFLRVKSFLKLLLILCHPKLEPGAAAPLTRPWEEVPVSASTTSQGNCPSGLQKSS